MAQRSAAVETIEERALLRTVRPIDLVHLARQCLGDEGLEQEILRLFKTTMGVYQTRLSAASTPDELKLCLHSIKGAASGVGAWTIADIAKTLEADLAAEQPLNAEHLADLAMAIEEVGVFVSQMLSNELA